MSDVALLGLMRTIAARDSAGASRLIDSRPSLAVEAVTTGATRADPDSYFLTAIRHYAYAGDTALHIAAAAYDHPTAEVLIANGADVAARNRRGASPLHYAADGIPEAPFWNPPAQRIVVEYLIAAGADPDALDKSGVTPLHRAVRTRCASAVAALLEIGADPRLMNKSGSTPLHLAVQNTGRGETGSEASKAQQRDIILLLVQHGARASDRDAKGTTVADAATSGWIRELLSAGRGGSTGA